MTKGLQQNKNEIVDSINEGTLADFLGDICALTRHIDPELYAQKNADESEKTLPVFIKDKYDNL